MYVMFSISLQFDVDIDWVDALCRRGHSPAAAILQFHRSGALTPVVMMRFPCVLDETLSNGR